MTVKYNRTHPKTFDELSADNKKYVIDTYSFELSDCHQTQYVLLDGEPLPLSMFMRVDNNRMTHGIYSISAFSGFFITFSRDNEYCTVSYKIF